MRKYLTILPAFVALTATVAQAQQLSSATFGMMEARWLGPGTMSGRITDIEGINKEPKTIYVASAGGGIWKSTNAGASFKPVFDKYCQSIGDIAIDQLNPKVVYAGTGESNMRNSVSVGDGLYKTSDGGDNWTKIGLDSTEHIAKIAIDPKNSNIVFVAAPGPLWSDSRHRGLYKSEDAGKTWKQVLFVSEKAGAADVIIDPSNPNTIYASTWEFRRKPFSFNSGGPGSGIWKSVDGGKNWRRIQSGFPQGIMGRTALALAPSSPNNLVAITELENDKTGLYITDNGGENWKSQSATMNVVSRPFYFACVVIDPKDPKRIYRPGFVFSYSSDGGYSFFDASNEGGWVHSDHHALWINPVNTSELWLGTDGGVYVSLDRGATWTFKGNLPLGQFYHVAVDQKEPYRMYGGLQDNGSWVAPSAAPGGLTNAVWQDIYGGDGFWVVPDCTDPNICYAEYQGGNMGRVNLTNGKQVAIQPQKAPGDEKLRWNWNTPIHVGPVSKALYTGAQYVFKSTDKGRNWVKISPDLTTNDKAKQKQEGSGGISADNTSAENHCTLFNISESPLDSNIIWAGTDDGNLQVTVNGGKAWTNTAVNYKLAGVPAQTWVSSIEPSLFDKNVVYATFDNHMYGDMNTYVAKSSDLGKTWQLLKGGDAFTGFAHKIKEDLVNKDLLFLGTEMGLYGSLNGGKEWFRMKNNIPWYALVRDIQIQPKTNDLVLGTHGRGIIVVDDISPMRSMTSEIASKEVVLFENKPLVLQDSKFGGSGFPGGGGWSAPNPPSIQPMQYYLKDRVMSGEVKIDILDKEGKLVQSMPGSKRKGINKVTWNLRMNPPKVAAGSKKMDAASFAAPMVLPGDYTVKLTVGNKEYTQPLKVVHDDKGELTEAERQAQYDASMKLYKLNEDLAALVDTISKTQTLLTDNKYKLQSEKSKKLVDDYYNKLEELRASLMSTKQASIFADEKRLKEEMNELYTSLVYSEAAPSNLQIQNIDQFKQEIKTSETKGQTIMKQYSKQVMDAFKKENIDTNIKKGSISNAGAGGG
ncbi:MAG: glycosyl hydrolase [Bacteroidota bacterium]